MSSRSIVHEELFPVSAERMFALLYTPSAIRQWWGVSRAIVLAEAGGIWAATWGDSEDDPDFIAVATIRVFDPPRRMVLDEQRGRSKGFNRGQKTDFVTEYLIEPRGEGVMLRITQSGFPPAPELDELYAATEKGWRATFQGIRKFLGER